MDSQNLSIPLLSFILVLLFILRRIWKKSKTSKLLNLPPGPWKLPVLGNLHQLVGGLPHHRLRDLANKYGPVMLISFGQVPTVIISSPETAKLVMKTHDLLFAQRPWLMVADIIFYKSANIAFAPYGDRWKQLRKLVMTELLGLKRVKLFRRIREDEVTNLINRISAGAGTPVNLTDQFFTSSTSIIGRAAFGKKCKDQEEFVPVVQEIIDMASGFNVADVFPSIKPLHVIWGIENKLWKIHKKVDYLLENIIRDHKDARARGKNTGENEDIVHAFLDLQEHGNLELPLTNENIKGVILDLFIAGIDTSATLTEWTLSELIKNPKVLQKAQAEVRKVLSGRKGIDETVVDDLPYLRAVVKETLRFHPPAPLLTPRENNTQCQINGYDIPANTRVLVNAWAIGRDPNSWVEAEKFLPERFLDSSLDYNGNNFEYIPFGAGRRICPGILFGLATVELALTELLYNFDWELPGGQKKEELDMTEDFALAARRRNHLYLIPSPYQHN